MGQAPMRIKSIELKLLVIIVIAFSITGIMAQDGGLGPFEVNTLAYSPDGSKIAVGGGPFGCLPPGATDTSAFAIRILDAQTGQLLDSFGDHQCTVNTVAWSPDGSRLASSGDDGIASVWNVSTGQMLSRAEGIFQVPKSGTTWNSDGQLVADFNPQTSGVRVWNATTGTTVAFLEDAGSLDRVTALAWSPDGSRLAVANNGRKTQIWDVTVIASTGTGQLLATFTDRPAASLAWSPDRSQLAIGGIDVLILDPTTGNILRSLVGHTDVILSLAWSSDGTRLASGSLDGTIRIWNTVTGGQMEVIQSGGPVRSVDWSPTGNQLAYGGANDTVQIVDAPSAFCDVPIVRVSVASDGTQGNSSTSFAAISGDGRYVAFHSLASNLVAGDTNNVEDVFIHDRIVCQTTRISVNSAGLGANGRSGAPMITADGRHVAFVSDANNLVSSDSNGFGDVFVHDRQTGQTTRVSVSSAGEQSNGKSGSPAISTDGRYVAFLSEAGNLVSGDTNAAWDVFVHDRQTGATSRVSVSSAGEQGNSSSHHPALSADGRYVAFYSEASNLVSGDTNAAWDVFVHDRQTGQTTRVSVNSAGEQGNIDSYFPALSADGRYVAFSSFASNLVSGDSNGFNDVFVHDRQTGATSRVSVSSAGEQGNSTSNGWPSISADGRYVAFYSRASNLVGSDTNGVEDIFVHDRQTGQTVRVSIAAGGTQGNGVSKIPAISSDGQYVAFHSDASNLVSGDSNAATDVFVAEAP